MSKDRDFRQELTDRFIAALEAGTAPWQQPWDGAPLARPYNPVSGTVFRGGNQLWLMLRGYPDPRWCTYKQAQEAGWQVRRDEKSTPIEYWQWTKDEWRANPATGQKEKVQVPLERPRVFYANVFNARQIDGMPELARPAAHEWEAVARAEQILTASGARILHDQADGAFYQPSTDTIHLPPKTAFPGAVQYYGTALHELGHWTGKDTRLNRDILHPFGSPPYAREELRAEIFSVFMSAETGLPMNDPQHFEQHAAYVKGWVQALKDDKHEIFRAAKDAEGMHEYVLGLERAQALAQPRNFVEAAQAVLGPDVAVQAARPEGRYVGAVLYQTADFVVQDVGRRTAVVHDKSCLSADTLTQLSTAGDRLQRIQYSNGRAEVAKALARRAGLELEP